MGFERGPKMDLACLVVLHLQGMSENSRGALEMGLVTQLWRLIPNEKKRIEDSCSFFFDNSNCARIISGNKVGDSIDWRTGYLLGTIHTSFGERRHNQDQGLRGAVGSTQ